MTAKRNKREIKRIHREIDRLKDKLKKVELRPCHGDTDLRKKEEELILLKHEIYDLEKSANQYAIHISGLGNGK